MAQVIQDFDTLSYVGPQPLVVQLHPAMRMNDDQLYEFAQINGELRIERTAKGDLIVRPPTGGETGSRDIQISGQLVAWSNQDGSGIAFGSSTGFRLPNGAMRSPDACWVRMPRWDALSLEDRKKFPPLCPDFVIELRSETDTLRALQEKMQEYLDNGAQLGWLIDPLQRRVYVYRPGHTVEELDDPKSVSGDPLLPGFVLDLQLVW